MTTQRLLPMVEGHGDERAVPELLRRILHDQGRYDVEVLKPHRRGELPQVKANFERYLQAAMLESGTILCVLDYDCASCNDVELDERRLRERARSIGAQLRFDTCLIVKEFESMFLYDPHATRSVLPLIVPSTRFPSNPEDIRDVKGWLSNAQPKGAAYKPTTHQAKIVSQVDLNRLRANSASFQRLEKALLGLVN